MYALRKTILTIILSVLALIQPLAVLAATAVPAGEATESSYILGDSIAYGLHLDGLEARLQEKLGGTARISYDGARSITTPGNQIKKTAFESVDADQAYIATASVIIIVLGMSQQEISFADSQQQLIRKLKAIAPKAKYYWVDIGATISTQAAGWSARNKIIYDNAASLGYSVISRYKTIFGPSADPLNITPGRNYPGWVSEPGNDGPGNIHGFYTELSQVILNAIVAPGSSACSNTSNRISYVLGDSIAFGLHKDRLASKLQINLGGSARISYDTGRSITTPGIQIKKTAFESVDSDKAYIATANIIIIALGTNQKEDSFADSQQQLMQKLRTIAPYAKYYWIDIGATIATQVDGWNARNKTIYGNAARLGYSVISRYKAIFGPAADPLNITPGKNFPGLETEPGYGGPGNIHGVYPELNKVIIDAVTGSSAGCAEATPASGIL